MFYRIVDNRDGTVDVWLTPGVPDPDFGTGRYNFSVRYLAVKGIDPNDPQWDGDLEGHIREHYQDWIDSAEEEIF